MVLTWQPELDLRGPGYVQPRLRHRFTGDPDGDLSGRAVTETHGGALTWTVSGTAGTSVVSGTAGYPTGQTGNVASYFSPGAISGGLVGVGARIVFPPSDLVAASAALGLFTDEPFGGATNNSPAHLAVTPTYLELAVFSGGAANFTRITPVGERGTAQEYANPLTCDGVTENFVNILLDRTRGQCYVYGPDGRVFRYQHPYFTSITGTRPFYEPFGDPATGPVGRFAEVWAYDTLPGPPDSPVSPLSVAHARTHAAPGAGPATARPSSRAVPPGSPWWDTDQVKGTRSDGVGWRDDAGQQVGNLLTRNAALAHTDSSGIAGVSCSKARIASVRPPGRASCYKLTVTTAGTIAIYVANLSLTKVYTAAVAGQSYSAGCAKITAASGTTRSCYVAQGFYNDANTAVGAATNGTAANCGVSGTFTALPQTTGNVAPAGATQTTMLVYITGTTLGEVFYLSELFITPGSVAGYQEP